MVLIASSGWSALWELHSLINDALRSYIIGVMPTVPSSPRLTVPSDYLTTLTLVSSLSRFCVGLRVASPPSWDLVTPSAGNMRPAGM